MKKDYIEGILGNLYILLKYLSFHICFLKISRKLYVFSRTSLCNENWGPCVLDGPTEMWSGPTYCLIIKACDFSHLMNRVEREESKGLRRDITCTNIPSNAGKSAHKFDQVTSCSTSQGEYHTILLNT